MAKEKDDKKQEEEEDCPHWHEKPHFFKKPFVPGTVEDIDEGGELCIPNNPYTGDELGTIMYKMLSIPTPCLLAEQLCRKAVELPYNPRLEPIILQLIRAANSVSANILEGLGTGYVKNSMRYYRMARGSALECTAHARCLLTLESECEAVYDAVCNYILSIPHQK